MTERALLNTTLQVCRDLTRSEGRDFTAPSAKAFNQAIKQIKSRNAWVDVFQFFDGDYHFTDERFVESRKVITDGLFVVKASVKTGNFDAAKKKLGKCSHGGPFDFSSRAAPTGGINKDTLDAEHGFLHRQAAAVAVATTTELLVDIRGAAGDADFLRLMGISRASKALCFLRLMGISRASKALCFVIDTTGSMSDDTDAVKSFTTSLIDSRRGTQEEPSLYILVPFNGNATLLVTVTGSDSVTVTEVALVETSGSGEVSAVEPLGGREFLVCLDRIPSGNFVVRLRGEENSSTSSRAAAGNFQRQSSTSLRASSITLTVSQI
ncbi:uncharacterized protein FYW47_018241 [Aplochiton taeniatus]